MDTLAQLSSALVGRYAIEREIGAGGMATVYLARDVRHDRNVALKVLNPELGAVLGVERFLSEIKVTANLQHPNLLPLFDSGEAEGLLFYVMPFVEGESLRARLTREKQLPIDNALHLATAVASALDYAHRHGVIHRDLKPENILLHEGEPLVADFGIALAVTNAGGNRITQTGLSLGTPQYMSPEQATGDRAIDGRTDIYSLAAVLYEMLTGDPPHTGSSAQAIIARLLTDHARPVRASRDTVPPHVEAAIDRALAKLPADRFATAHEFADALAGKLGASTWPGTRAVGSSTAVSTSGVSPASWTRRARAAAPWLAGVAIAAGLATLPIGIAIGRRAATEPAHHPVRFTLAYAPGEQILDAGGSPLAFSPDGRLIAYHGGAPAKNRIFVRPIDQLEARSLSGTEGATSLAFSPDGKWIAFATNNEVNKVQIEGGPVLPLGKLTAPSGISWSPSGVIVGSERGVLVAIPENGGAARLLARPDSAHGERLLAWPLALADGKSVLYTVLGAGGLAGARIGVLDLASSRVTTLDIAGTYPMGIIDGRLVYASSASSLLAIPFDARRLRATGPGGAVPVANDVRVGSGGAAKAALSASGSLVYLTGNTQNQLSLVGPGTGARTLTETGVFSFPRFSPDGRQIAVTVGGSMLDIWIYELATNTLRRLTTEGTNEREEWTPDGRRILFRSERGHGSELWWQAADGSSPAERIVSLDQDVREGVISPDGHTLLYRVDAPKTQGDLWIVSLDGDRTPRPYVATPFIEQAPRFSPDGHWVAYESNESGAFQVYVRAFPGPGSVVQISTAGGLEPVWSRDGRHLVYRDGAQLIETTLSTAGAVAVTARRVVYEGDVATALVHANYDVAPDGVHYLVPAATVGADRTIVVNDWRYELRARTGAKE